MNRDPLRVFILISSFLALQLLHAGSLHLSSFGGMELEIRGSVNASYNLSDDLDDRVPHYSDSTGHRSSLTFRESQIAIRLFQSDISLETSFDFMGPGPQIVTAGLVIENSQFRFAFGKFENLVSTRERTLFYDGYFTSGGIQTGAKANQRQIQFGWKPTQSWTFTIAANDEPAQVGGMDQMQFTQKGIGTEFSIQWSGNQANFRMGGHVSTMQLTDGHSFRPAILMMDGSYCPPNGWTVYGSAYVKQAGSQFMPADTLLDYVRTPDGNIREVRGSGLQAQVIRTYPRLNVWASAGRYRVCTKCVHAMLSTDPGHILVGNDRLSAGASWNLSDNSNVGLEYALFRTEHLTDYERVRDTGSVFMLKWTLEF